MRVFKNSRIPIQLLLLTALSFSLSACGNKAKENKKAGENSGASDQNLSSDLATCPNPIALQQSPAGWVAIEKLDVITGEAGRYVLTQVQTYAQLAIEQGHHASVTTFTTLNRKSDVAADAEVIQKVTCQDLAGLAEITFSVSPFDSILRLDGLVQEKRTLDFTIFANDFKKSTGLFKANDHFGEKIEDDELTGAFAKALNLKYSEKTFKVDAGEFEHRSQVILFHPMYKKDFQITIAARYKVEK